MLRCSHHLQAQSPPHLHSQSSKILGQNSNELPITTVWLDCLHTLSHRKIKSGGMTTVWLPCLLTMIQSNKTITSQTFGLPTIKLVSYQEPMCLWWRCQMKNVISSKLSKVGQYRVAFIFERHNVTRHWPPRSKSSFRRIPFLSPERLVKGKIFDHRFGLSIKK